MLEEGVQYAMETDGWVTMWLVCPVTGEEHMSVHCALAMELECPSCGGWHSLESEEDEDE